MFSFLNVRAAICFKQKIQNYDVLRVFFVLFSELFQTGSNIWIIPAFLLLRIFDVRLHVIIYLKFQIKSFLIFENSKLVERFESLL